MLVKRTKQSAIMLSTDEMTLMRADWQWYASNKTKCIHGERYPGFQERCWAEAHTWVWLRHTDLQTT